MPHSYAVAALLATASAFVPHTTTRNRRAPVRHILDNSQDDPIARFERENDGAKVFEKLVDYPCEFTIKVIGFDDETFAADMCRYIAGVVDKPVDDIAFSKNDSKQKTYTSVTIKAPVASADELYQCYAVLRQDPRVKIAL
jgi:putative lipoic acid-binding regulatory protein